MKREIFLGILLVFFVSLVGATDQTCGENQRIFRISAETNAHAENYNLNSYVKQICFDDYFQSTYFGGIGHTCGSNEVLKLSGTTNAHAEIFSRAVYNTNVCYGDLTCIVRDNSGDGMECQNYGSIIVSMSGETNAHLYLSNLSNKILCCESASVSAICDYDRNCEGAEDYINCPSDCPRDFSTTCFIEDLRWENEDGDEISIAREDENVTAVVIGNSACTSLDRLIIEETKGLNDEVFSDINLNFAGNEVRVGFDLDDYDAKIGNRYEFSIEVVSDGGWQHSPDLEIEYCPSGWVDGGIAYDIKICYDYNELEDPEEYCGCNALPENCFWSNEMGGQCVPTFNDTSHLCGIFGNAETCEVGDDIRTITYNVEEINSTGGIIGDANDGFCDIISSCTPPAKTCSEIILCPQSTKLPFFSLVNVFSIVVLIIIGYLAWNYFGKKKRKRGKRKKKQA